MKRFVLFLAFVGLLGFANSAKAQQYFTYDGDEFSVLLTCNSSNEVVIAVEFSFEGEWVPFTILDYYDGGDEGFVYNVEDGVGNGYSIVYLYGDDAVVVMTADESTSWVLERRQE